MKWLILLSLLITANTYADEFADAFSDSGSGSAVTRSDFEFFGSLEFEQGHAISNAGALKTAKRDTVMANRRFKLKAMKTNDNGGIYAKVDFVRDDVTGQSFTDFRELRLHYKLASWLDLNLGKQVSTWGVGDNLFINDLFPKNWVSNFSGRDMEYMKDSSTSLRTTAYFGPVTWDLVYTPKFAPDTTPTGCHLTTYSANTGAIITQPSSSCPMENFASDRVTNADNDGELATSIKFQVAGQDISFYGYRGFYKNPKNMQGTPGSLNAYFPRLNVYGLSSEGQIGAGILSFEYGYYDNREDTPTSLMLENDLHKYLVGYKVDLTGKLTVGAQVYGEYMTDYNQYEALYVGAHSGSKMGIKKENQLTYTLRIIYKMQQETLFFNLFTYIRPDDHDSFTKIDITKRLDNNFSVVAGASIFTGKDGYEGREFGSQRNSDLVYVRFKYDL